jgi:hypothetical protein
VYFVVVENGIRFALIKHGTEPFMLSTNSVSFLFPGGLEVPNKGLPNGELSTLQLTNLRSSITLLSYCALISIPAVWSFTRRDVS